MDHYGLIGNPVSQSLSEKYFTDKFTLLGIDARYERFLLNSIHGLRSLLDAYPQLRGLSVTSPFKTDVLRYCDELDETAREIQAVNTLNILRNGGDILIRGYNTDADGFAAAILPLLKGKDYRALILGSGGAARAVAFALKRLSVPFLVVSRNPGPGKIAYRELDTSLMQNFRLLINATPLGMGRFIRDYPDIPYHLLRNDHLLFDLIYNPSESLFLKKGREQGAQTENGLLMLQAQAEKAWEIWKNSK